MQKFSYHTHTSFSDGKCSLEQMLDKAVSLGWEEIGVSDHLIIHKNMKSSPVYEMIVKSNSFNAPHVYRDSFDTSLDVFRRNSEYIRGVAKKYPIKVFIGYEVDYFTYDGWEDEFKNFIKQIDYDYLLNGNHFFFDENGDNLIDIYRFDNLDPILCVDSFENYISRHYKTIQKAVNSGLFDILAHLDYARRSVMHKVFPCINERLNIVDCLKQSGMGVEISTKGLRKVDSFYPEDFILKELIKKNVPIVIDDDAHNVGELGYKFDKAEEKLKELGCCNRYRLK